jgi:RNA polymerase sigma-70 factor (ECF subfamily)
LPSPKVVALKRDPIQVNYATRFCGVRTLEGHPDDRVLLERVRARDPDALLTLYRRYGPRVFSLTCRLLGNRSVAEEIVQDTFWKLWHRPEMFDPQRGVLIAWLYTVSRNLALDYKRRQNRSPQESVIHNHHMDMWSNAALSPNLAATMDPSMSRVIREAMDALSPDQKDAIHLAYFEDLSQSEISERLGIALGTIKTRIRLGLRKLRESVQEHVKGRR